MAGSPEKDAAERAAARVDAAKVEFVEKFATSTPGELASDLLDKLVRFGLKLLAAVLIYIVGAMLIKWIRKSVRNRLEKKKTEPTVLSFTMSVLTAVLWILLIVMTIGALGIETTSIAALLAAGGVAIGMSLSGTMQNFAGGIMILIFKPFKAGDFIEAQGITGVVKDVSISSTKVITMDNKVVVLPNGALFNGVIKNYSKLDWRRVDVTVSVEYGSDADAVREALLGVAAADPRIKTVADGAPADPFVGLLQLNSSSVDFTLRVWCASSDYFPVFFSLNERVYAELPKKGIRFPFPQLSVHFADKEQK